MVEIDPAVVRVAARYFDFTASDKTRVIETDGRVYVKRALRGTQRYDLIMLDAFDHEYIPEHLLTQEFLQEVKSLLAPDGVLAANTFSSSGLYEHESRRTRRCSQVLQSEARESRDPTRLSALPDQEQLRTTAQQFSGSFDRYGFKAAELLPLFTSERDWNPGARVLTDQYSPANLLNLER